MIVHSSNKRRVSFVVSLARLVLAHVLEKVHARLSHYAPADLQRAHDMCTLAAEHDSDRIPLSAQPG